MLILNPDCVMDPGCAAALRARLLARPEVGLAAALLRDPDGTPQLFARRDLRLPGALLGFTSVGRRIDARRGGRALARRRYEDLWAGGPPREPVTVFCPAAACVMAARARPAARAVRRAFPLFFNDGDLCARLARAGRRAEIVPAATAVHGYGTSVARAQPADPARMRAEWVASMRRYAGRWWPRPRARRARRRAARRRGRRAPRCASPAARTRARCAARSAGSACPAARRRC